MNLQMELAPLNKRGLLLRNPVMMASGTFGYGVELADLVDVQRLGAVICKGTTLLPRTGNEQPRTWETPSGLLNSIGLQNPGIDATIKKYAPIWRKWQTPVIVNIAGETIDEFRQVAERLEGVEGIAGIELNVSCPNILEGGAIFADSEQAVANVTAAVRSVTTLPLIVKLSANSGDARPTGLAAAASGADALSLINTISSITINIHTRRLSLGNGTGGLSGPAVKPIALYMVYELAREIRLSYPHVPIIGMGGICNTNDALEFFMAGASAIQLGTVNFVNPNAAIEILEGLDVFFRQEGIEDIKEIIGAAL